MRLEKLRDALEDIKPNQFPSFKTANGDFVRPVPKTQEYPKSEKNDEQAEEYELTDVNNEKQVFRFVVRNWDEKKIRAGEKVTVSLPTYNTRVDDGSSAQARDSRQALQNPDSPRISIMHPGMGSDPLTPEQIQELLGEEGYSGIANKMLSLLDSLGVKSIDINGASMGGYAALFLAAQAVDYRLEDGDTMKVNKVRIAATPIGSEIMSANELRKAEGSDGKRLPAAIASPFDPYAFKAVDLDRNWLMQKVGLAKWLWKAGRADPIGKKAPYTQSMAKYSPKELISKILDTQDTSSVNVAVGTEDRVGPAKDWYTLVDDLRGKGKPYRYENRLTYTVFPGASHVFYENPSRITEIMDRN